MEAAGSGGISEGGEAALSAGSAGGEAAGPSAFPGSMGEADSETMSLNPHSLQNLAVSGFSNPHSGHFL
jgi:hypothetical protein